MSVYAGCVSRVHRDHWLLSGCC